MSVRCGQILLVNYPFTDNSGTKLRPALVVSADPYNHGEDFVIVPISSVQPADDRYALTIKKADPGFHQTGLKRTSYLRWTKPLTISEIVAERRLGHLPPKMLSSVHAKIRQIFQT